MKLAIITDSTCDLSQKFIEANDIHIIPIKIIKNNQIILDDKSDNKTIEIRNSLEDNKNYKTEIMNKEEIYNFLIEMVKANQYNEFIFMMSNSLQNELYNNILEIMNKFIQESRIINQSKGIDLPFKVELIDTKQLSSGLAVLIGELIINYKKGISFELIAERVKHSINYAQVFLIPEKLGQLYKNPKIKNNDNKGITKYLINSALNIKPIIYSNNGKIQTVDEVKGFDSGFEMIFKLLLNDIKNNRLTFNHLFISYGGGSEKRKKLMNSITYRKLENLAAQHNIAIVFSKMSATMMINVGIDALAIGYISSNYINLE